jgi:hypothetical protein
MLFSYNLKGRAANLYFNFLRNAILAVERMDEAVGFDYV